MSQMLSQTTFNQMYPYDEDLSYHLVNLALVGEIQPVWESADPKHPDLDDLFAIPQGHYPGLFIGCKTPTDAIYDDIHGYIHTQYELIGAIRIGQGIVPDYEEHPLTASEIKSIEDLFKAMSSYSQRVQEEFNNNLRYNFSRLLIGYALRAKVDGHGVIAIRGTVTPNEWLNNLNYQLVPFHLLDEQYGSVHNGFRDLYKGIRGRFRELVEQFDVETPLYLVGHSLGAALSQLAALDIAIKSPERAKHLRVYSYASPRVGDATFAEAYNRLVGTSYQIVNVCDVVPYLPFEELGAFLKQQGYPYADTKGALGFVHQAGNLLANHTSSYHLAARMKVPAPIDASVPKRLT
jgi:triacylglycerol lipase